MQTLKDLSRYIKKMDRAIAFRKAFVKEGQEDVTLTRLEKERARIFEALDKRAKNPVRSTLTKKKQREQGLLPQIKTI
jgi:hypothetical protein